MEQHQVRRVLAFDRVLAMSTKWADQMADAQVLGTLDELRQHRDSAKQLDMQKMPLRRGTKRAEQIRAWKNDLRDQLMVLRTAAEAHLKDDSGKRLKVKVPHFKATPAAVLEAVQEFDRVLRPKLPLLTAKKIRADCLDRLKDASGQLHQWRTQAADGRAQHKQLRAEMTLHISTGLRLLLLLRRLLKPELAKNPVFRTEFEKAAKVAKKPGLPREATRPKRERVKYRKRPKKKEGAPQRM